MHDSRHHLLLLFLLSSKLGGNRNQWACHPQHGVRVTRLAVGNLFRGGARKLMATLERVSWFPRNFCVRRRHGVGRAPPCPRAPRPCLAIAESPLYGAEKWAPRVTPNLAPSVILNLARARRNLRQN